MTLGLTTGGSSTFNITKRRRNKESPACSWVDVVVVPSETVVGCARQEISAPLDSPRVAPGLGRTEKWVRTF